MLRDSATQQADNLFDLHVGVAIWLIDLGLRVRAWWNKRYQEFRIE